MAVLLAALGCRSTQIAPSEVNAAVRVVEIALLVGAGGRKFKFMGVSIIAIGVTDKFKKYIPCIIVLRASF